MATSSLQQILSRMTIEVSNRAKNSMLGRFCELLAVAPNPVCACEDLDILTTEKGINSIFTMIKKSLCDQEYVIRTQALRCTRYLLMHQNDKKNKDSMIMTMKIFYIRNVDLFVVNSLERETKKNRWERLQALQLIEILVYLSSSYNCCFVSLTMLRSVQAVAAHVKDQLHRSALDCLKRIMLCPAAADPSLSLNECCSLYTNYGRSMKTITDALLNNSNSDSPEFFMPIILTILQIYDAEESRKLLASGAGDILGIISILTETREETTSDDKEHRRFLSHYCITTMMRSWTGIMLMTSDNRCFPSLVRLLGLNSQSKGSSWARESIFELMFEVISVVRSDVFVREINRRKSRERACLGEAKEDELIKSERDLSCVNLLHNYIAMVLMSFIHSNVFSTVLQLSMCSNDRFSQLASRFLHELLSITSHMLPSSYCSELLSLPIAMDLSMKQDKGAVNAIKKLSASPTKALSTPSESNHRVIVLDEQERRRTNGMKIYGIRLSSIVQATKLEQMEDERDLYFWRRYGKPLNAIFGDDFEEEGESEIIEEEKKSGRHTMQHMNVRMHAYDENSLIMLLKQTNVTVNRDYKQWDFSQCLHILRFTLSSKSSFSIVMNKTKFISRLLTFFDPHKGTFTELNWVASNFKYCRVGYYLFLDIVRNSTAAELTENTSFLEVCMHIFNDLIDEILGIEAKNARSGIISNMEKKIVKIPKQRHRTFSRMSLLGKCSLCYFDFINILSSHPQSHFIFRKYNVISRLKTFLSHETTGDSLKGYLLPKILASFNYQQHSAARQMLFSYSTCESSSEVYMKLHVISILRLALRDLVADEVSGQNLVTNFGWCIPLIISLLRVSSSKVNVAALSLLEEACVERQFLDLFLSKSPPSFDELDLPYTFTQHLKIRFLGSAEGITYCTRSTDTLNNLIEVWKNHDSIKFTSDIETRLFTSLNTNGDSSTSQCDCELSYTNSIRTKSDNYFFKRLHTLPWNCSISIELPNNKTIKLATDSWIYTTYAQHMAPTSGKSKTVSSSGRISVVTENQESRNKIKNEITDLRLATTLVFTVLSDHDMQPFCIDDKAVIRVRPSISQDINEDAMSEQNEDEYTFFQFEDYFEATCNDKDRNVLFQDTNPVCCITKGGITMNFRVDKSSNSAYLESVAFELPVFCSSSPSVTLGSHLYGELARTEEGITLLKERKDVDQFVDEIFKQSSFSLNKRSCLWSLAMIGSTPYGIKYLNDTYPHLIPYLASQAMSAGILSMRGTCFYMLGLFSLTQQGKKILKSLGWLTAPSPVYGVVFPSNLSEFFSVDVYSEQLCWANDPNNIYGITEVQTIDKNKDNNSNKRKQSIEDKLHINEKYTSIVRKGWEILGHVSNLCNHVSQKQSVQALQAMKKKQPELFASSVLLFESYRLLNSYSYQLPARKFILCELFNHVIFDDYTMKVFDTPFWAPTSRDVVLDMLTKELDYFASLRKAKK